MYTLVPEETKPTEGPTILLGLRLVTLIVLVAAVTIHIKSLRVFRWEQSVSGGVLITFCCSELGLALCAGTVNCGGYALQAYLCCTGATILAVNAAVIWLRWKQAGELTQVVAELLDAMGVPLRRQILIKALLSSAAAFGMLVDMAVRPLILAREKYVSHL